MIPHELSGLFWNIYTEKLDTERSKDLIILTTLRRGTLEQIELIFRLYGTDEVRRVFRADALGLRTLPAPCVYLWGLIFLEEEELAAYKKWHEDPVLRWLPTRGSPLSVSSAMCRNCAEGLRQLPLTEVRDMR
jgi:hypothetical protein